MQILTSRDGPVLRLQINRPEKRNVLTSGMYEQASHFLEQVRSPEAAGRSRPSLKSGRRTSLRPFSGHSSPQFPKSERPHV